MIVHIFPADEKYYSPVSEMFESKQPGLNRFLIVSPQCEKFKLRPSNVAFIGSWEKLKDQYHHYLQEARAVIFHFMDLIKLQMVESTPADIPLYWSSWGVDVVNACYRSPYLAMYLPRTRMLNAENSFLRYMDKSIREYSRRILNRHTEYRRQLERLIHRFSGITTGTPGEYELLLQCYGNRLPPRTPFFYVFLRSKPMGLCAGKALLVGNSSWAYNNHADIFLRIKKSDIEGRNIIVPLSYGDMEYQRKILVLGKKTFGKRFIPLTSFMARDEYSELMSTCGHFVSHSTVQMAAGNILMALAMGIKVHLHQSNPFFDYYQSIGVDMGITTQIDRHYSWDELNEMQQRQHQECIWNLFNQDQIFNYCLNFANT